MQYIMDIGCNMINAEKYIKLFLKKSLNPYNLNATEGLILLLFLKTELKSNSIGMTQEQIIEDLKYDKGVITRAMQSLEGKKYVIRQDNPNDGRSYIFILSEKAEELKIYLYSIIEELNNQIFKGIDKKDIEKLSELIHKLSDNAWNYYNTMK